MGSGKNALRRWRAGTIVAFAAHTETFKTSAISSSVESLLARIIRTCLETGVQLWEAVVICLSHSSALHISSGDHFGSGKSLRGS